MSETLRSKTLSEFSLSSAQKVMEPAWALKTLFAEELSGLYCEATIFSE